MVLLFTEHLNVTQDMRSQLTLWKRVPTRQCQMTRHQTCCCMCQIQELLLLSIWLESLAVVWVYSNLLLCSLRVQSHQPLPESWRLASLAGYFCEFFSWHSTRTVCINTLQPDPCNMSAILNIMWSTCEVFFCFQCSALLLRLELLYRWC